MPIRPALPVVELVSGCLHGTSSLVFGERTSRSLWAEGVIVTAARDWMGETTIEVGDPGVYRAELLGRSAATGATMWPRLGQVMSEAPEYVA